MTSFSCSIRKALTAPVNFNHPLIFVRGRTTGCRPGWARINRVIAALSNGSPINTTALAKENQCCTKTISRDISMLKRNGYPIAFDFKNNTFLPVHNP